MSNVNISNTGTMLSTKLNAEYSEQSMQEVPTGKDRYRFMYNYKKEHPERYKKVVEEKFTAEVCEAMNGVCAEKTGEERIKTVLRILDNEFMKIEQEDIFLTLKQIEVDLGINLETCSQDVQYESVDAPPMDHGMALQPQTTQENMWACCTEAELADNRYQDKTFCGLNDCLVDTSKLNDDVQCLVMNPPSVNISADSNTQNSTDGIYPSSESERSFQKSHCMQGHNRKLSEPSSVVRHCSKSAQKRRDINKMAVRRNRKRGENKKNNLNGKVKLLLEKKQLLQDNIELIKELGILKGLIKAHKTVCEQQQIELYNDAILCRQTPKN